MKGGWGDERMKRGKGEGIGKKEKESRGEMKC